MAASMRPIRYILRKFAAQSTAAQPSASRGTCGGLAAAARSPYYDWPGGPLFSAKESCTSLFSNSAAVLYSQGARSLSTLDTSASGESGPENSGAIKIDASDVKVSSIIPKLDSTAAQQAADIGYSLLGRFDGNHLWVKRQQAFAVVQVGSHQFKVTPGDLIYTEKLKYADINDKLALEKVLLVGTTTKTVIGRPTVPDATVYAAVEEHALDAKVIIFKKRRRKNYRRTRGHRQELTALRILKIDGIEDSVATEVQTPGQAAAAV